MNNVSLKFDSQTERICPITGGIIGCGESVVEFKAHNCSFIKAHTRYDAHLRHESGAATYEGDEFIGCWTNGDNGGGAIWCKDTNLWIDSCVFNACAVYGNDPQGHGGGVYAREEGFKVCRSSNFTQNHADYAGGGIAFHNISRHVIQNCIFDCNNAGYYSAFQSIHLGDDSSFSGLKVRNGSVSGFASAFSIQAAGGWVTVSDCEMIHGTAQDEIGAIYIGSPCNYGDIRLSYLWFANNVLNPSANVFHANDVVVDKVWFEYMSDRSRWINCLSISNSPHVFFRLGAWPGGNADDSYIPFPQEHLYVGTDGSDWRNCGYNTSWKCRTIKHAVDRWGDPRTCNIQQFDATYYESNINVCGNKNIFLDGHSKNTILATAGTMIYVGDSGKLNLTQFNINWGIQHVIAQVTSGAFIMDNCAVTGGNSQHSDNGIYLTGGSTTITSCSFTSLSTISNPTIKINPNSYCNIIHSSFTSLNSQNGNGCAVEGTISNGKALQISYTTFSNISLSKGNGSPIYLEVQSGGTFNCENNTFYKCNSNIATNQCGGGSYLRLRQNSAANVKNCTFNCCQASVTTSKTYNQLERGSDTSKGYTKLGRGGGLYLHLFDANVQFRITNMKNDSNKADFGRDIFVSSPDLSTSITRSCITPFNDQGSDQIYSDNEIHMMAGYDNHNSWTHIPLIYYIKTLPSYIYASDKGINVSACGFIKYQCNSLPLAMRRQTSSRKNIQVDTNVVVNEVISLTSGSLYMKGKNSSITHSVSLNNACANSLRFYFYFTVNAEMRQLRFIVPSSGSSLESQIYISHSSSVISFISCSVSTSNSSPMTKPFVAVQSGRINFNDIVFDFRNAASSNQILTSQAPFVTALSSQSYVSFNNSVMNTVRFAGSNGSYVYAKENSSLEVKNCTWNDVSLEQSSLLTLISPNFVSISNTQIESVSSTNHNGPALFIDDSTSFNSVGTISLSNSSFRSCSFVSSSSQSNGGGAIFAKLDPTISLQFRNLSFSGCSVTRTANAQSTRGGAINMYLSAGNTAASFEANVNFEGNSADFGKNIFVSSPNLTASITRPRYLFFRCYDNSYTQGNWAKKWMWDRKEMMGFDNHNSAEAIPLGYYLMDQQEQIYLSDEGKDVTACGFYDYHCKTFNYAIWRQTKNNVYLSTTRKNVTVNVSATLAEDVVLSEGTMRLRSNRSDDSVPASSRIVISSAQSSSTSSFHINALQDALIVSSIPCEYFDIEFHVPSLLSSKSSVIRLDGQTHLFVRCGLTYQTPSEGLSFVFITETRGSLILDNCYIGTPVHSSSSFSSSNKFNEVTPKYLFNNGSFIKVSGTSTQAELRNMQVHNTEHGDSSSLVEVIGGASLTLNRDEFVSSQMVKSSLIRGNDANNITVVDTIFHSITTQQKGGSCVKIGDDSIVKTIEAYTPHQQLYQHTPTRNTIEAIFSFRNCTFDACISPSSSSKGGALQMILKQNRQTSSSRQLLISGCSFTDCACPTSQSGNGKGGAIFLYLDDPLIDWCISTPEFETNKATLGLNLFVSSYKLNESITAARLPFISASEYTFDHSLYQGFNEFNSWKAIPLPFYILPLHQHIYIKETGINTTACGFTDYQCESLHYAIYRQNRPTTKEEVAIMERVLLKEEIKLTGKELEVISNKLIDPSAQTLNAQIVVLNGERNELDGIIESTKKALFDSVEFIVPKAIQSHSSVVKVTSGEFLLNRSIITPSDPSFELSCRFISATGGKIIIKSISFASNSILVSSSSAHSFSASNSDNGVGSFLFVEGSSTEGTIDGFSFTQVKCQGRTSVLGIANGATLSITNSDFSHVALDENCIVEADNIKSLSISDTNISSLTMKSGSTISVSSNDALTIENCSFSSIKLDTIGGSAIRVKEGASTHSERVSNEANASSMNPSSFKRNSNKNLEAVHITSCYFSECTVSESSCTGGAIMITPTNMMDVDIDSCSFSNCITGSTLFEEASISSTSPENTDAPTRGGAIYFYFVDASANWRINNPTWSAFGEANMNNAQIGRDFFISSANLTQSVRAFCLPFFDNVNYDECYYFDQSSLRGYDEHDDWTSIPIGFYLLRQHASIYVSSIGYDTTACGFTMYHCHSLPWAAWRQENSIKHVTINDTMYMMNQYRIGDFLIDTNLFSNLSIVSSKEERHAQFVVRDLPNNEDFPGVLENNNTNTIFNEIDFCLPETIAKHSSFLRQTGGTVNILHCSVVFTYSSHILRYPAFCVEGGELTVEAFVVEPTSFVQHIPDAISSGTSASSLSFVTKSNDDVRKTVLSSTSLLTVNGVTASAVLKDFPLTSLVSEGNAAVIDVSNRSSLLFKESIVTDFSTDYSSILSSSSGSSVNIESVVVSSSDLKDAPAIRNLNAGFLNATNTTFTDITRASTGGAAIWIESGTDSQHASNSGEKISLHDCLFTRCKVTGEESELSLKNAYKANIDGESSNPLSSVFDSSCGGAIFASIGAGTSVRFCECRYTECAVPNEKPATVSSSSNAASANGCGGAILLFLTDSEADWAIEAPTFPVNPSSLMNLAQFGRDLFVTSPALNHSIIHSRLPFFPLNRRFDHSSMEGYDEHNNWTSIPLGYYLLSLETTIYISTEGFNTTACGFDDYHCESLNYAVYRQNDPQKGNVTVIESFELNHEFSVPNELFVLTALDSSIADMIIMNVEESNQNGLFDSNSNATLKQLKIKVPKLISNHEAIFTVSGNSFTLTSCSLVAVEDRTISNAFMKVTAGKVKVSEFTFTATETSIFASSNSVTNLSDNILNNTSLFSFAGSSAEASFDSFVLKQVSIFGDKSTIEVNNGASFNITNSEIEDIHSHATDASVHSASIFSSDQAELLALNNVTIISISLSSSSVLYSNRINKLNISFSNFNDICSQKGKGSAFCFDESGVAARNNDDCLVVLESNIFHNCSVSELNSAGGALSVKLKSHTRFEVKETSFESCAAPNTQGSSGKGGAVYMYAIDSNLDWLFSPIAFPPTDELTANKAEFGRDLFVDSYKLNETITRSSLPFIPIIPPDCYYFDHSSLSGFNEHNNWTVIPLVYYNLDQHKTIYVSSDGVDTTACGFDEYHCKTLHWAVWRQTSVKDKNVTVNSSFTLVNEFNVSFDSFILKGNESHCKCFITQTVPNSNMKGIIENHNIASITDIHFVVPEVLNRHTTLINNRKGTLTIQRSSLIPSSSNRIPFSFLEATYGTISVTDFVVEPLAVGQVSVNDNNILLTNSYFISSQGEATVVSMTNLAVSSISSISSSPLMQFGSKTTTVIKNSQFEQINSISSSVICFSSVKNATVSSCVFTAISKQNGDGSCIEHRGETDSQLISRIENCSFTDCHISKNTTSNSKKSNEALSNTIKNNQKDQSRNRNNNQEGFSGGALFIEMNYLAVIEVFNCAFNDCSAPSEPGSKGKGGSIGIYTQNLDASFCLRDLNFTSSSAELGLNVFVDGLYLPKEITYSTLTFFKVFDGWNVHELEGFDEHNSTVAIPLGYYLLELSNWIHTSTEGFDVSACGFWNYTCNSLNYAIERDLSKMRASVDRSCYFKGENVISRMFLIDGKAVDSEMPSTAPQPPYERKGIIRFIDSPANGIKKAPLTVQSSVEIDNCIFCIPSSFPSHSSLLHVTKDSLRVFGCEILPESSFIDPFDSTLTSASFTGNDLQRNKFSFSLILMSGGRLEVENMQLTNFEFNAPIFSLEEGALFLLKKLNVSDITFSNGAVISMKNAHPKEDFSLKLEDSVFVRLTQERSGPCVLSVNHGKASLTRIIVEKCVSESSLGCALNVENAVLAVSDCVFNGEIRNVTTSSDEASNDQKRSTESNEQLIDGYRKGLISKNALLNAELEAEEYMYAICDWKGSILRVVNCTCDISASQLSYCESGAFSVTGGNVVMKDVVFEANGIESKMYPKARKDIICDGNAALDITATSKPTPTEVQSVFNHQNYSFDLSLESDETEGTTEGCEESKEEEEEEQDTETEHLWILSASCTLHNDASITKGFLFYPSVSKMTRSDQPEIEPDKPEDVPSEEEKEGEVKEEEDQTTEIEGDSSDGQKSAFFKRSRNHRKLITTAKSKILNTDPTEDREPITVTFTGASLLPCNVTAEMRYILKDGSLNRTTDVAVTQFVDPTTVKVVLNADLVLGDEEEGEEKEKGEQIEEKKEEKEIQLGKNEGHFINEKAQEEKEEEREREEEKEEKEEEEEKQIEDVYVCLRFWSPSGTVLRTTAFYMNTRNTPPLPDPPADEPEPEPVIPSDDEKHDENEKKSQSGGFLWWIIILIAVGVVIVAVIIVILSKKKKSKAKPVEEIGVASNEKDMKKDVSLDETEADANESTCKLIPTTEAVPINVVDVDCNEDTSETRLLSDSARDSNSNLFHSNLSSPINSASSNVQSLSPSPFSSPTSSPITSSYTLPSSSPVMYSPYQTEEESLITPKNTLKKRRTRKQKRSEVIANPLVESVETGQKKEKEDNLLSSSSDWLNSTANADENDAFIFSRSPASFAEDDLTSVNRGRESITPIKLEEDLLESFSERVQEGSQNSMLNISSCTSSFDADELCSSNIPVSNSAGNTNGMRKTKTKRTKRNKKKEVAFDYSRDEIDEIQNINASEINLESGASATAPASLSPTTSFASPLDSTFSPSQDELHVEGANDVTAEEMLFDITHKTDHSNSEKMDKCTIEHSIADDSLTLSDCAAPFLSPKLLNNETAIETELLPSDDLDSSQKSQKKKKKSSKDNTEKEGKKSRKKRKNKRKEKEANVPIENNKEEGLQDILDEFFDCADLEFGEEELRELAELELASKFNFDE
ncbi:uncharacterized protein MONOS_3825 [Monocercomonoides exilis]|uniref:uncharacterized protein n=1 Tax=Monocercomonoides exilis TaxID=2049356 RepID=UPI0035594652|nr:hypothetical protein MONOS_3825 [Monocercomonoides exilis]|eukprot:MONOS_3825.1-p1 / transcript=MONOS_3825.1 / gene=MONOS_3825 / organism=Monocercomonoides_exilis_PA203 / gene_product=unspecified product / transcript_product=unspecified product / location=Mono_scaffold00094:32159-46825(-) / protein_length=4785 / sequence_SO=supercontig / SO=protein_coding / is_pseudo=false